MSIFLLFLQMYSGVSDFIERSLNLLPASSLLSCLYVFLGILLLFYGKRIFHLFLSLSGFLSGSLLALNLDRSYLHLEPQIRIIFVAALGLSCALLFGVAYKFSFFLAGASLAIYYAIFFYRLYIPGQNPPWIYVLGIAVLCGTLSAFLRDEFIRLGTSICGAALIADTVYAAVFKHLPGGILRGDFASLREISSRVLLLLFLLALTMLGFFCQKRSRQKKRKSWR